MRLGALAVLALWASAPSGAAVRGGVVQATVTGIRAGQQGTLVVALYQGEAGWLALDSALAVQRIPVTSDSVTVTFTAVPPGEGYAIAVIHDRNANDRMDMRWFPFPKPREGAGVSGNHLRMGKPEFSRAVFAVGDGTAALTIRMRY